MQISSRVGMGNSSTAMFCHSGPECKSSIMLVRLRLISKNLRAGSPEKGDGDAAGSAVPRSLISSSCTTPSTTKKIWPSSPSEPPSKADTLPVDASNLPVSTRLPSGSKDSTYARTSPTISNLSKLNEALRTMVPTSRVAGSGERETTVFSSSL